MNLLKYLEMNFQKKYYIELEIDKKKDDGLVKRTIKKILFLDEK